MGLYDRSYLRVDGDEDGRPSRSSLALWKRAVALLLLLAFLATAVALVF